MWPINFLASACAAVRPQSKPAHGNRTCRRVLCVESMEPRLPLSATALMLTDAVSEMPQTLADAAVTQLPLTEDPASAVTIGTLNVGSEIACLPVAPAELASIKAQPLERLNSRAVEAVMQMGPMPWLAEDDGVQESEQFTSMTLMSGPAPSGPDSSVEADPIVVDPPEIVWFDIDYGVSGIWHFEGEVEYEFPLDLTVVFGGVLEGHSTTVSSGGTFILSLELPPDTSGMVTAQAFTSDGIKSNIVDLLII